jgi:putative hemolysin
MTADWDVGRYDLVRWCQSFLGNVIKANKALAPTYNHESWIRIARA